MRSAPCPCCGPGIFVQLGSKDGRDKQYDAVPPLTGPEGKSYTGYNYPTSTGYTFMLTNKASKEAQIAAIKMLDYIFTDEGQIDDQCGSRRSRLDQARRRRCRARPEALTPMYKPLPAKASEEQPTWGALAQYNNTPRVPERAGRAARTSTPRPGSSGGCSRRPSCTKATWTRRMVFPEPRSGSTRAPASEMATLQTNLDSYVNQNELAFITGSKNIDTDWDAYVKGLDGVGMKRYLRDQPAGLRHVQGQRLMQRPVGRRRPAGHADRSTRSSGPERIRTGRRQARRSAKSLGRRPN